MKKRKCKVYAGECTVTDAFCARRYAKAQENPNDPELDGCRKCGVGWLAHERLKVEHKSKVRAA